MLHKYRKTRIVLQLALLLSYAFFCTDAGIRSTGWFATEVFELAEGDYACKGHGCGCDSAWKCRYFCCCEIDTSTDSKSSCCGTDPDSNTDSCCSSKPETEKELPETTAIVRGLTCSDFREAAQFMGRILLIPANGNGDICFYKEDSEEQELIPAALFQDAKFTREIAKIPIV